MSGHGDVPTASVETRQAIADAALRLFRHGGYNQTTVDAIADGAGVSRATVFRYFPSKEEIIFARYPREIERLRGEIRGCPPSNEHRALRAVILGFAGRLEADTDSFSAEVALMVAHPRLLARALVTVHHLAGGLAQELAAGRRQDHVDIRARVLAHTAVTALQEAVCVWRATAGTSLVEVVDHALKVALPPRSRSKG